MRVVHCYGQTPETQAAIDAYWEVSDRGNLERPQYDKYEEGRAWQPTVCGLRAPDSDVVRPSDFVATVNHTDPYVDQSELGIALEHPGLPFMDGDVVPAGPPGPAGPAGPAGAAGAVGPAGTSSDPIVVTSEGVAPKYSPEMYDDCRDAFGGISAAGWRQLIDDQELAKLTDDDVRALFKVMCLMMAASDVDLFQEFFDDALPLSTQ